MPYKLTFQDGSSAYLAHYGVKGMKWGIWNAETRARYIKGFRPVNNQDRSVIKSDTILGRVSRTDPSSSRKYNHDPLSGNMKYLTSNAEDLRLWAEHFADLTKSADDPKNKMYAVMYRTTKDLDVASAAKAGEVYVNRVLGDAKSGKKVMKEAETDFKKLNPEAIGLSKKTKMKDAIDETKVGKEVSDSVKTVLGSMALKNSDLKQRIGGNKLIEELKKDGHQAVEDALGWNVSYDPLIVFEPKDNLRTVYNGREENQTIWRTKGAVRHSALSETELDKRKYALPEKRKFPLPDRAHVISAIRFFNYVDPVDEKRLANAILKRMRELNITDVNVGDENRFKKYYKLTIRRIKWTIS